MERFCGEGGIRGSLTERAGGCYHGMVKRFVAAFLPLVVLTGVAGLLAFWWAWRLVGPQPRAVDSRRVEKCLQAYISFRKTGDHSQLTQELQRVPVLQADFEKVIDRFIHYRMSKSSMDQAMRLLEAFKGGHNIKPDRVFSPSDQASFSFQLDAEVLTVFNDRPDLVREAFGS